jgi:hypothetical protein
MGTVKAWAAWLCRAWPFVAMLVAAALPLCSPGLRSETAIRFVGAVFQVASVVIVTLSVGSKLEHFYGFKFREIVLRWFRECPACRKAPITSTGHVTGSPTTGSGVAAVQPLLNNLSVDGQIAVLYQKVVAIEERIAQQAKACRAEVDRLDGAIAAERASVPAQLSGYNQKLGVALVGGIKTELLGAGLLIIGVVFGTLPCEVASLFSRLLSR